MSMKPIRLPEPPGSPTKSSPDIFEAGVIRRAVIIGNGYEASENQSIGMVQALGLSENKVLYVISSCSGHKLLPFHTENGGSAGLSSVLEADVKNIITMARDTSENGPLLIVACGRDTISIASSIKKLASDNVFVVQIQHPRSRLNRFDLVITPQHDYYPLLTPSAQEQVPNFIQKWITPREPSDSAAIAWYDEFAPLPKPLLVVNIGGPTRFCNYGENLVKQLVACLYDVLASCGSVRISFSRRTPEKVSNVVLKELGSHPKVFIWDGEEPNPHMGHLAWADAFIVTADSVSMLSETCSTGKPVYVVGGERCTWKHAEFHKMIRKRGLVRPFTGLEDISKSWSYPPLNDTAEAANRVREAIAERGWRLRP